MPTELPQIRKDFFERLSSLLAPYGLKYIRSWSIFSRKTDYGSEQISFTWVSYPGDSFILEMSIGIRYDAIENLRKEFQLFLGSYKKYMNTIGNRLPGMFRDHWKGNYDISNRTDMEMALINVMDTISDIAFPYFERFSTLEAIADILWRDDDEARRLNSKREIPYEELAAAYLLDRREIFDDVISKYAEKLQKKAENSINDAETVAEYYRYEKKLRDKWTERDRLKNNQQTN
ncbi:MAG: hypothetical protein ACYC27_10060 [Armatimonadota bacterium]